MPSISDHQGFYTAEPERQTAPFIFNAPHSGRRYRQDFLSQTAIPLEKLRAQEDFHIDQLFADAPRFGAPIMAARFPRSFVDLNREPYELDPEMFNTALPSYSNTRSARVLNGIGTIARKCASGEEIYDHKLDWAQVMKRIENFYMPYHQHLQALLDRTYQHFNIAILIDCHSMPAGDSAADIVIGDRFGQSAATALSDYAAESLTALGYQIARNQPYAGGFITEHYGKPKQHRHALQIEINRAIYVDEARLTLSDGWERLRQDMNQWMEQLSQFDVAAMGADSCPT